MTKKKAFLPIDLDLLNNPKYEKLSLLAVNIYSVYADRSKCSAHHAQNGNSSFIDSKGVFIYYSNDEIREIFHVSERTVTNARKELSAAGLIEVVRNGMTGYKIYVKSVEETPKDVAWKFKPYIKKSFEKVPENQANQPVEQENTVAQDNSAIFDKNANLSVPASDKASGRKIYTISDSHSSKSQLNNTSETTVTRETGKIEQSSPAAPSQTYAELALDGLEDRAIKTVGVRVWGKIRMIAQGSHEKANKLLTMIYKAKSQVAKRVRMICKQYWDLPEIADVAYDSVYFEKNDLLARGLESALVRIVEIHYKSEKSEIKNLGGFMYTFLRNSISQNVEMYIEEQTNGYHCLQDVAQYVHNTLNFRTV